MRIFDWFRNPTPPEPEGTGISRRDFFARLTPREGEDSSRGRPPADPRLLHRFTVARFPFHDGPVLVPILRVGEEFRLAPEPPYVPDPTAVRIERGRDHLGYAPEEIASDLLVRMLRGEALVCRASHIDPTAELAQVLTVEILLPPEPAEEAVSPEEGAPPG